MVNIKMLSYFFAKNLSVNYTSNVGQRNLLLKLFFKIAFFLLQNLSVFLE